MLLHEAAAVAEDRLHLQGRAVELEGRLRDKELEVEELRKALAQAGVKQETVASPDDHVSASPPAGLHVVSVATQLVLVLGPASALRSLQGMCL